MIHNYYLFLVNFGPFTCTCIARAVETALFQIIPKRRIQKHLVSLEAQHFILPLSSPSRTSLVHSRAFDLRSVESLVPPPPKP